MLSLYIHVIRFPKVTGLRKASNFLQAHEHTKQWGKGKLSVNKKIKLDLYLYFYTI